MKRTRAILGIAVLLAAALAVTAQTPTKEVPAQPGAKPSAAPARRVPQPPITLQGEILDMSCYVVRGFRGTVHRDCALRCIASGVCMGMMGPDSMLYMLTLDHARAMAPTSFTTPDPFVLCKGWAGRNVEIVGGAFERRGMHIIEVTQARLLPAPTPAK